MKEGFQSNRKQWKRDAYDSLASGLAATGRAPGGRGQGTAGAGERRGERRQIYTPENNNSLEINLNHPLIIYFLLGFWGYFCEFLLTCVIN